MANSRDPSGPYRSDYDSKFRDDVYVGPAGDVVLLTWHGDQLFALRAQVDASFLKPSYAKTRVWNPALHNVRYPKTKFRVGHLGDVFAEHPFMALDVLRDLGFKQRPGTKFPRAWLDNPTRSRPR